MAFGGNWGPVIVGLAIGLGALQLRTLLFHAIPTRRTASATTAITTSTCQKDPISNDICSLLPADKTASFLWNQGGGVVDWNQENDKDQNNSVLLTRKNHYLNSFRLLRGVSRIPSHNSLKRLLQDRENKRPLKLWMFVNPLDVQNECPDLQNCETTWIQLLKDAAGKFCHVVDIEWTIFDWTFANTEYYTQLLTAQRGKKHGPDLIVHALSRHDLLHSNMETRDPHSVLWEEHRRRVLQDFVRAARRSSPCQDTVIIFVDDFIPTHPSLSLWVQEVNSRMLYQVSEYYSTGLISYGQLVKEWIMNMETTHVSSVAPNASGKFETTAHKVLARVILYGLLHFAVTFCSTKDRTSTVLESFIPIDVASRVNNVLPPYLDADQTLLTVSEEWSQQEQTEQQFHETYCHKEDATPPMTCLVDFTFGQPLSTLGNGEQPDGWTRSSEGTLRFTRSAQLKWSLDSIEAKAGLEGGTATVFMLLRSKEEIELTWTVSSQDASTFGNFSTNAASNPPQSNIAVQMLVQLPDRIGDALTFHLECSQAENIEIVGFFLCHKESIKRIAS